MRFAGVVMLVLYAFSIFFNFAFSSKADQRPLLPTTRPGHGSIPQVLDDVQTRKLQGKFLHITGTSSDDFVTGRLLTLS